MELIPVSMNGVYTEVHPTALGQHKALGWRECEKQAPEGVEAQADGSMSPAITGDGSGKALPEIDPEGAKKATVAELREALTAKGIEIPEGAKKAELQALMDAAQ